MPYQIMGLLEASLGDIAPADAYWIPILWLDAFSLVGDDMSADLFGLAKNPNGRGCFVDRGIPGDASECMKKLWRDNERFMAAHGGEGDFGHTHASLEEIHAALSRPAAPDLGDSGWRDVLETAHNLRTSAPMAAFERWRVIVWANW